MSIDSKRKNALLYRKADIKFHLKVVSLNRGEGLLKFFIPKLLKWHAMAFFLDQNFPGQKWRDFDSTHPVSKHTDLFKALVDHNAVEAAKLISNHSNYIVGMIGV